MSDLIKLTGLWLNDGAKGKYMSGTIKREDIEKLMAMEGDAKILIFKNDKEGVDKRPDYNMNATPKPNQGGAPSPQQQGGSGGQNSQGFRGDGNQAPVQKAPPQLGDDNIPWNS